MDSLSDKRDTPWATLESRRRGIRLCLIYRALMWGKETAIQETVSERTVCHPRQYSISPEWTHVLIIVRRIPKYAE